MSEKKIAPSELNAAAKVLSSGGLVIFPTETVYGLGCIYGNEKARARIYRLKGRPADKPLPVLIGSVEALGDFRVEVSASAKKVIDKFTPGALTFLLRNRTGRKIGFRIPDSKLVQELIKEAGSPIETTSANFSGEKAPISADEVDPRLIKEVDLLLDGGRCTGGKESTVVDLSVSPPVILREGAISREKLGLRNAKKL